MTTNINPKRKVKLKLKDLRPEVDVFGKKYRLPYLSSSITDEVLSKDAIGALQKAIDDEYPGIRQPEQQMLYLHLLHEARKSPEGSLFPKKREIVYKGVKQVVSFDDIKKKDCTEFEIDGVRWVFRAISALEYYNGPYKVFTRGTTNNHTNILDYCFQHIIYEGEKYKFDEFEEDFPWELGHHVAEIVGTLYIVLKTETGPVVLEGIDEIIDIFGSDEYRV